MAAVAGAAGVAAAAEVPKQAIAISEKSFEAGWSAYETVSKKGEKVLAREQRGYDFEKVAFQSLYGTALFGVGWATLKMGQTMMWLVNTLNSLDILGVINDEAVANMNKVGNILNIIDNQFMIPYGPAMPAAIVSTSALLEYARIRINLPETQRKVSDSLIAGFALALLWTITTAISKPAEYDGSKPPVNGADQRPGYVEGDPKPTELKSSDYVETYLGLEIYYKEYPLASGYGLMFVIYKGNIAKIYIVNSSLEYRDNLAAAKVWIEEFNSSQGGVGPVMQIWRTYNGFNLAQDKTTQPYTYHFIQARTGLEIGSIQTGTYWQANDAFVLAVDSWIAANPMEA